jgi:hypothetical protein
MKIIPLQQTQAISGGTPAEFEDDTHSICLVGAIIGAVFLIESVEKSRALVVPAALLGVALGGAIGYGIGIIRYGFRYI